jgi:hypothetical protein
VGSLTPGIDCGWLPRAAVRARQTRSFVYALITVFVSSIEARQPRAAGDRRCSSATRLSQLKEHGTLKSLCRGTKNTSDLARHAPSSRGSVRSSARDNIESNLRVKATNIDSRGSREQSTPGFTQTFASLSIRLEQFKLKLTRISNNLIDKECQLMQKCSTVV